MVAADIMVTEVITVTPDETLHKAAQILLDHRISGLPVVDGAGRLMGLISEGDLMRRREIGTEKRRSWWLEVFTSPDSRATDYVRSHATKVADLMTRDVITATESTSLQEIASLLERYGIKRVPIMRDGTLVGLVSRANILQAFAAASGRSPSANVEDDRTVRENVIEQMKQVPGGMPWLVTVTVENGIVELRGAVKSNEQQQALRVAAETAAGVKGVNVNLFKMSRAEE
jgi:CBS domain-containing protein